jgi:hypothetical protein
MSKNTNQQNSKGSSKTPVVTQTKQTSTTRITPQANAKTSPVKQIPVRKESVLDEIKRLQDLEDEKASAKPNSSSINPNFSNSTEEANDPNRDDDNKSEHSTISVEEARDLARRPISVEEARDLAHRPMEDFDEPGEISVKRTKRHNKQHKADSPARRDMAEILPKEQILASGHGLGNSQGNNAPDEFQRYVDAYNATRPAPVDEVKNMLAAADEHGHADCRYPSSYDQDDPVELPNGGMRRDRNGWPILDKGVEAAEWARKYDETRRGESDHGPHYRPPPYYKAPDVFYPRLELRRLVPFPKVRRWGNCRNDKGYNNGGDDELEKLMLIREQTRLPGHGSGTTLHMQNKLDRNRHKYWEAKMQESRIIDQIHIGVNFAAECVESCQLPDVNDLFDSLSAFQQDELTAFRRTFWAQEGPNSYDELLKTTGRRTLQFNEEEKKYFQDTRTPEGKLWLDDKIVEATAKWTKRKDAAVHDIRAHFAKEDIRLKREWDDYVQGQLTRAAEYNYSQSLAPPQSLRENSGVDRMLMGTTETPNNKPAGTEARDKPRRIILYDADGNEWQPRDYGFDPVEAEFFAESERKSAAKLSQKTGTASNAHPYTNIASQIGSARQPFDASQYQSSAPNSGTARTPSAAPRYTNSDIPNKSVYSTQNPVSDRPISLHINSDQKVDHLTQDQILNGDTSQITRWFSQVHDAMRYVRDEHLLPIWDYIEPQAVRQAIVAYSDATSYPGLMQLVEDNCGTLTREMINHFLAQQGITQRDFLTEFVNAITRRSGASSSAGSGGTHIRTVSEVLRANPLRYDLADKQSIVQYTASLVDIEGRTEYTTLFLPEARRARRREEVYKEVKEWFTIILSHGPQNDATGVLHPFRTLFEAKFDEMMVENPAASLENLRYKFTSVSKTINTLIMDVLTKYGIESLRYLLIQHTDLSQLKKAIEHGYKMPNGMRPFPDSRGTTTTARTAERAPAVLIKAPSTYKEAVKSGPAATTPGDTTSAGGARAEKPKRSRETTVYPKPMSADPNIKPPQPRFPEPMSIEKNCYKCGTQFIHAYHANTARECQYSTHPQANLSEPSRVWYYSAQGKLFWGFRNSRGQPYYTMPLYEQLSSDGQTMTPWSIDGQKGGSSKSARTDYGKGPSRYQPPYHGKTDDELSIVDIETIPRLMIINSEEQGTPEYTAATNDVLFVGKVILPPNNTSGSRPNLITHLITPSLDILFVVDTMSTQASYVSTRVAGWLQRHGVDTRKSRHQVCCAFNICKDVNEEIMLFLDLPIVVDKPTDGTATNITTPTSLDNHRRIAFWARILDTGFDLVVGLPTLRQHNMLTELTALLQQRRCNIRMEAGACHKCDGTSEFCLPCHKAPHYTQNPRLAILHNSDISAPSNSAHLDRPVVGLKATDTRGPSLLELEPCVASIPPRNVPDIVTPVSSTQAMFTKPLLRSDPKDKFLTRENYDVETELLETPEQSWEWTAEERSHAASTEGREWEDAEIQGDPDLQQKLRELCSEYHDIFCKLVRPTPANVPPMDLHVDLEGWAKAENSKPPRAQSHKMNAEIKRQVESMLELKVIQPSTDAAYYSQVLLTAKPGDKWRFCIDFRALNLHCLLSGWPLANISHIFHRIGSRKPKYFAVMDLTSGFHQAPLSPSARIFTAFITYMGIYEWLRVPMGLKGAPSFFQKMMASVVLVGLVYLICEVYLDDIITYGMTIEEFLQNLRLIFERLRRHNVTLNPKKCRFGLAKVEYCGHTIDETGIHFSREKLQKVIDFPKPTTITQMRSFLGLANYFRDHVQHHSQLTHPLHSMISDLGPKAAKRSILTWTPELAASFKQLQDAIQTCPKLFFMDMEGEHSDIILETDASKFGIGAYLYQRIHFDEATFQDFPISFLSSSFNDAQTRWNTNEKECYAIFFSLDKLSHLLRDVFFHLRTDHANLTYLNNDKNEKVRRWKVAIQEFNFNITHIAGEENVVADYLSRLPSMEASSRTSVDDKNYGRLMMMRSGTVPSEDEIPPEIHTILSSVHNDIVGHNGVKQTLERLCVSQQSDATDQQTWRKYIRQFRQQCATCQAGTNVKFTSAANPFTLAALHPMDKLAVDTIGPLPTDANGNGYIIVFIDAFTRFVELYAVPDTTAEVCAGKLLDHVGRYGVPVLLQSDQGSQFVNQIIQEFTTLMGVKHHLTLQYSSESNGLVERANKEVMRHLRNIVFDRRCRDNFSTMLPLVQRIMNTAIHSVTKISPAQLLFGNAVNLDRDIFLPPIPPPEEARTFTAYMQGLIDTQARLINVAKEHQQTHDLYHLASKDPGDNHTAYPIGAYVMAHYRKSLISRSGAPSKLHMPLRGPLQVVAVGGDTYTLQDLITNKTDDYHVTQIRPFVYDPKYNSPDEAARHNHGEYLVEKITEHRGDRHEKDTMEFLVKWAGYNETENSWEPYSELKHNEQLHSYLETHRMRTLIPRSHKL